MDNILWGDNGYGTVQTGPSNYGGVFLNFKVGIQVVFDYTNGVYVRNAASGAWSQWRTLQ
jgi:hypothetical protein